MNKPLNVGAAVIGRESADALYGAVRQSSVGMMRVERLQQGAIGEVVDRDVATVAANAAAVFAGANVLRVHNVPYTRDLVRVLVAIEHGRPPTGETE